MTDPTRFDLDDHQRAMLAEMGVRVWWPKAQPEAPAHTAHPLAHPPAPLAQPVAGPAPVTAAVTSPMSRRPTPVPPGPPVLPAAAPTADRPLVPSDVAHMDWVAVQASAAACQACGLSEQRTRSVWAVGDAQAHWMVIGDPPTEADDTTGQPFEGDSGVLLDHMLNAVGLSRTGLGASGAYVSCVTKCRAPAKRQPSPDELARCAPYLERQIALVQPKIILLMGRHAAQALLQTDQPLGQLRGQVHHHAGVPVVVTYHPSTLLHRPADKARAWADLVLALQTVRASAA